ncbi:MAG TPA: hypothetical protein VNJ54_05980 [Plantibacter sp.]|uniref:hypothetical protein n=1 Tax=unclassified Plantibacter TaxID=2624265 RepID=UPI002C3E8DEB|nr:hypothetical protein [Plantibacter sp.]
MTRSRRSCARWRLVAPLIVVAVLSGCSSSTAGLDTDTGRELQNSVVLVANAAVDGDPTGALAALDALAAQVSAAENEGTVSEARAADIRAAIDLVRIDLTPVVETPAPAPEPVATESGTPADPVDEGDDGGDGNKGNKGNKGNNGNGNGKKDK